VQETYCRFLGRRDNVLAMNEAETRSYLFRIATNLLRDRWRRGESSLDAAAGEELVMEIADAEEDSAAKIDVQRMMRTLKPRAASFYGWPT